VYADSESLWRDSLAHNPDAPMVHYNLGIELHRTGRLDEAADHYRRAIALRPDDPHAYNNLANVRATQGRAREALDLLEEAVAIAPDYARARWNLALQLEAMGRVAEARPHFKASIDAAVRAGEEPEVIEASRLYFARTLLRSRKYERALRILDDLLADAPDSAPAHAMRGRALLRLHQPGAARAAFEAALALDPGNEAAAAGLRQASRREDASGSGAPAAGHR
jgi:tetratricopeptide (TPR) repeat protein